MNPGELFLLGLALAGSAWAFVSYWTSTRAKREARRRERMGAENAQREQRAAGDVCVVCNRPVEPRSDIFDEANKTWWHAACWRDAVR